MKRFLHLKVMLLLLFLATISWAQERSVTGKVTATEDGGAMPGVNVIVKGTTNGTVTDVDGVFTINVPSPDAVLVFSFIGFATNEVSVGNQTSISVKLTQDVTLLSEVVIRVPYGETQRGLFTGSVAQLGEKQLMQRPVTNVINALAGAAPGIQTSMGSGQPGAAPSIRIRGIGSYTASNDPLYVVDGVPYSGNIANLNINDIEDISVLKDASAAALYGSRAANGVIMIATKKGKSGKTQIQANLMQGSVSRGLPEYDRVNAYQYYPLMWEAYRNSMVYPASTTTPAIPIEDANQLASGLMTPRIATGTNAGKQSYNGAAYSDISQLLGYNPFNVASTEIVLPDGTMNPDAKLLYPDDLDWAKPITRHGSRSDYQLSVSNATDKSDVYVSMGYLNERGFVLRSDYERFTGRINVNTKPLSWFKTGMNISATISTSNQASTPAAGGTAYVNPFFFARTMGPIYPVYARNPATGELILDAVGNKQYDLGNMTALGLPSRAAGGSPGRHIVAETNLNNDLFKRNILSGRTYGEVTFLKNFKFTTNVSVDITNNLDQTYDNTLVGDGAPAGRSRKISSTTTSYTFNQLLNYTKSFGDHNLSVLLGHENYNWVFSRMEGFKQGIVSEGNTELVNFTTVNTLTSRTDRHRVEGYFSRVSYDFKEKYIFSASYRKDGSSRFSPDVRWGDFWALGAAWRLDQESFINSVSWVDLLKIRTSFGESGNDGTLDPIDNTQDYYPAMGLYSVAANNANEPGVIQTKLSSPNLLWETSTLFDVGVDFGLLGGRVSGSVEFFNRQSSNLLFGVPIPLSSGLQTKFENAGTMYNRGIEIQVAADVIRKGDFTWNINVNATTLKNKITKLPQKEIIDNQHKREVGSSIFDFWLRDWYGVDPANGAALYRPAAWNPANSYVLENGDSVTTNQNNAKFHYAGSAIPDVYGGITNTFSYKNISLAVMVTYQIGGKVYDGVYASLMPSGNYGTALHKDILKRWQKPGDITDVPRMDEGQRTAFGAASDRWLVSASYLTIRTANLSYSLPSSHISKIGMQSARVFVSGENLRLFSARKGMNVTQNFGGTTTNVYSPNRIFTVGLNVTL